MAKQVKQFRYYSEDVNNINSNYPSNINKKTLVSGETFAKYMPVSKLGIQSVPGTKFYLNNSSSPIIIGHTGIFELDLNEFTEIIALRFDAKSIQFINDNLNAYLIIDMIYEGEGEV